MLFVFFTTITFIAEVIIACTLLNKIIMFDRAVIAFDNQLRESHTDIGDISELARKISEQFVEFSQNFAEKVREEEENFTIKQLNKLLLAYILYKINIKPIKKFRKSKLGKSLAKGFSMLQSMV